MKIVVISDYLTHHQSYICEELINLGNDVHFIACKKTPEYRIATGFDDMSNKTYVLHSFDKSKAKKELTSLIDNADFVIIGTGDNSLIKNRIKKDHMVFRFSEHLSKSNNHFINFLRILKWKFLLRKEIKNKNCFLLCSSFYASKDYKKVGISTSKMLKWGYFPVVEKKGLCQINEANQINNFVWAGRLIDWKHPEICVDVYDYCKNNNFPFDIKIYGDGLFKDKLKLAIGQRNIPVYSPVKRNDISNIIKPGSIFLFSSDNGEGWGAILNEALALGAICICNGLAGSTKFLINDSENGFIYETKEDLYSVLNRLINMTGEEKKQMSLKACETIEKVWSAKCAASNLMKQITYYKQNGKFLRNIKGPGSKIQD